MAKAIGERRVENHFQPVFYMNHPFSIHPMALRGLHPGIEYQNPKRRKRSARRHNDGSDHVGALADPFAAKQHNAEKTGFEKECGKHFIAE